MQARTVFLISILLGSCSVKESNELPSTSSFKIQIYPAFLFPAEIEILDGNNPVLQVKILRTNKSDSLEVFHSRSFDLAKEELIALQQGIDAFNKGYSDHPYDPGFDGVSVNVVSNRLAANDTIDFWSPRRRKSDEGVYYELLDPVFDILWMHMNEDEEMVYLEILEKYFDFGAPIRKIGDRRYRIFGALTYDEDTSEVIDALINDVPDHDAVTIDMRNSPGMGTIYYPLFKKLLAKTSRITWIVNKQAREQLREIGWPEKSLKLTVEEMKFEWQKTQLY